MEFEGGDKMVDKKNPIPQKRKVSDLKKEEICDAKCQNSLKHEKHFCYMARQREIAKIARLSLEPKYVCLICGRVSHFEENLCSPFDIL